MEIPSRGIKITIGIGGIEITKKFLCETAWKLRLQNTNNVIHFYLLLLLLQIIVSEITR